MIAQGSRHWIASFTSEEDILAVTRASRQRGYRIVDVYTPYAVHGLDDAMGLADVRKGRDGGSHEGHALLARHPGVGASLLVLSVGYPLAASQQMGEFSGVRAIPNRGRGIPGRLGDGRRDQQPVGEPSRVS